MAVIAALLAVPIASSSCTTPTPSSSTPGTSTPDGKAPAPKKYRPGRYPTEQEFIQIAVDDPCEHLGLISSISANLIERLRGRKRVTLDEWSCMSEVIKDVNWEVGIKCHTGKIPFSVFAAEQKAGHLACVAEEHRGAVRCAVIGVNQQGRASTCR